VLTIEARKVLSNVKWDEQVTPEGRDLLIPFFGNFRFSGRELSQNPFSGNFRAMLGNDQRVCRLLTLLSHRTREFTVKTIPRN